MKIKTASFVLFALLLASCAAQPAVPTATATLPPSPTLTATATPSPSPTLTATAIPSVNPDILTATPKQITIAGMLVETPQQVRLDVIAESDPNHLVLTEKEVHESSYFYVDKNRGRIYAVVNGLSIELDPHYVNGDSFPMQNADGTWNIDPTSGWRWYNPVDKETYPATFLFYWGKDGKVHLELINNPNLTGDNLAEWSDWFAQGRGLIPTSMRGMKGIK